MLEYFFRNSKSTLIVIGIYSIVQSQSCYPIPYLYVVLTIFLAELDSEKDEYFIIQITWRFQF